jgi:hypothetical protein
MTTPHLAKASVQALPTRTTALAPAPRYETTCRTVVGNGKSVGMLKAGDDPQVASPKRKAYLRVFADGQPNKEGGARLDRQARTQSHRYSRAFLPCLRQVSITVSTRSTKRLPCGLSVPPLVLRHSTARRPDRSASLLVGSTPWTLTNVHSHCSCASNS